MKKGLSLLLLVMFSTVAIAQKELNKPNIIWGKEYNHPVFSQVEKIIGADASGTYVWRNKSKGLTTKEVTIEHYDKNQNLDKSNSLDMTLNSINNDFNVIDIFPFAGQIVNLTSFYDRGDDKNTLFVQSVDKSTLKLNDKRVKVAEISAKKRSDKGGFDYAISRDSSNLLIYSSLPGKRKDGEKLSMNVYNTNLDLQWEKTVELPFQDRNFKIKNYEVDKNGNVYLLGKLYKETELANLFQRGEPGYSYVIVAYRNGGEVVQNYDVSLDESFITDLTIQIGNNGDLICAGFYSEHSSIRVKGAFFSKINAESKKMYDIKKGDFKPEFLEQFMSKRKAKKNRSELFKYKIDHLVLRSDGGALIVAEQSYIAYPTSSDHRTYYHHNDIIVININPDGTIAWATAIPKRQVDEIEGIYASYAMSISGDKIYFIYNDHPKNINRTNYRKIKKFNGTGGLMLSALTLATVSADGSYEKTMLFKCRDESIIIRPKIARQISKNELIIFGTFAMQYKLAKIVF